MSYTKKTWASGDTVTSSALNNMETGIANAEPFVVTITVNGSTKTADYSSSEIKTIVESGREVLTFYDNKIYRFALYSSPYAYFSAINGSSSYRLFINNSKAVTVGDFSLYIKPSSGIPETDLAQAVKDKLNTFVVTLTPTNEDFSGTMDKTVSEINTAYEAGQKIVFRVINSATSYMDVDCTARWVNSSLTYPSFNAFIIDDTNNMLIFAFTGATTDGTKATFSTTIYPLTPMS